MFIQNKTVSLYLTMVLTTEHDNTRFVLDQNLTATFIISLVMKNRRNRYFKIQIFVVVVDKIFGNMGSMRKRKGLLVARPHKPLLYSRFDFIFTEKVMIE